MIIHKNKFLILPIIIILVTVTGCLGGTGKTNTEDQSPSSEEPTNTNKNTNTNESSNTNTNSNTSTNTSSTKKEDTLVCTLKSTEVFGTMVQTATYKFDAQDRMSSGEIKVNITLRSEHMPQRNTIMNQIRSEMKELTDLKGFSLSISNTSNGLRYTFKIDGNKASDADLLKMGLRRRNLQSVRLYAHNNGFTCKAS